MPEPFGVRNHRSKSFAQELKDGVADGGGHDRDDEILPGQDIVKGERKALALPIAARELTHQKIGIKEEDNEGDLNAGPKKRCEMADWLCGHTSS